MAVSFELHLGLCPEPSALGDSGRKTQNTEIRRHNRGAMDAATNARTDARPSAMGPLATCGREHGVFGLVVEDGGGQGKRPVPRI